MTRKTFAALGAAAALACSPALAGPSEVQLAVTKDPQGANALALGQVEIDAPPAKVWRLLTDCAATQRMLLSMNGCKVLNRDAGGQWDVREQRIKVPLEADMRAVLRSEMTPHQSIAFRQVEGDMKVMEGEWRLEPIRGGAATRVSYRLRLTPKCGSATLVRAFLRREAAAGLANLKTASEAA